MMSLGAKPEGPFVSSGAGETNDSAIRRAYSCRLSGDPYALR